MVFGSGALNGSWASFDAPEEGEAAVWLRRVEGAGGVDGLGWCVVSESRVALPDDVWPVTMRRTGGSTWCAAGRE